jgi:hypothetical protein
VTAGTLLRALSVEALWLGGNGTLLDDDKGV